MNTYSFLAGFAQTVGLIYFIGMFTAIAAYAFWPRNKARFEEASTIPLRED